MAAASSRRVVLGRGLHCDASARLLQLPHPATSALSSFVLTPDGTLLELNWHKAAYTSWFVGDAVLEDGGLYAATPVDPLLVLLPLLERQRGQARSAVSCSLLPARLSLRPDRQPSRPLSLRCGPAGGRLVPRARRVASRRRARPTLHLRRPGVGRLTLLPPQRHAPACLAGLEDAGPVRRPAGGRVGGFLCSIWREGDDCLRRRVAGRMAAGIRAVKAADAPGRG